MTVDYWPAVNGTVAELAPGPRIPRREVWIELPDEYPGFRVKAWVNYPRRLNDELGSGEAERITAALGQILLEHNGWCDVEGEPFPPASSPEFWQAIPDELAAAVIVLVREQVGKLASSLAARSAR